MTIQSIWKKADSLHGCLSSLKTITSHRRSDEYKGVTLRNQFVIDEDKILSSKAFRVLEDKTQVFTSPRSPLIRNRRSHVLEVVATSVKTAEILGLNIDLIRAAALGHDLGHVPFGHQGEAWMAKAMKRPNFCHEVMSVIVTQKIERKGAGLNLEWHTYEAMMCHSGNTARDGMSQEAWTLRYTDKFAYIFHDINDIIGRMRYPASQELLSLVSEFGSTQRERTSTVIAGLVIESAEYGRISFEHSELGQKFKKLRNLMYEIYPSVTQQDVQNNMEPILDFLARSKFNDPFLILALMTDKDIISMVSQRMIDLQGFNLTAVSEIVPYLQNIGPIDLCDPDLNW